MRLGVRLRFTLALLSFAGGCARIEEAQPRPEAIVDFATLYGANCAGCHGLQGRDGVAQPLNSPLYLSIVADDDLRRAIGHGVPGTPMLAFAREAGGTLTSAQIEAIVGGLRAKWHGDAVAGAEPTPAYSLEGATAKGEGPADPQRGQEAYRVYCARCHGDDGGAGPAGSVVEPAYLALTSDQGLRTSVIARHGAGAAQGWRSYVPGRPMQPQEISDVVAWLASHRGTP